MSEESEGKASLAPSPADDLDGVIEIRDPDIDVAAIMAQIRENVARRRAEGAYQEDVDAIADEVFAEVMAAGDASGSSDAQGMDGTLAELNVRWAVREVPFASGVPVLGGLIVALRNFWNWMSTKWYVRGLLQQQVEFNALVVRAFNQMWLENQTLAKTVEQQRGEIEILNETLDRLKAGSH
ncbi:MAG: hypothetical protein JXA21_21770 [Anaerolineae bacterium]|nr:hypothetical protein [Anaerolineae bacterium]